jgi:hypothetical protein
MPVEGVLHYGPFTPGNVFRPNGPPFYGDRRNHRAKSPPFGRYILTGGDVR